jgi:pyruvate/2-oxoglutarate dehydrogenase complex dihydrolipoamide dehydrogenase (E3) component
MQKFDAIIIGSGQAGNPLAHNLADNGWTVALIEKEFMGGSCINYGCTPTKTMMASAVVAQTARRGPEFGVYTGPVTVNLSEVVERKNKLVLEWRNGQEHHATSRPNITLLRGAARFTGPHTVAVNDQELTSEHIFINTGTSPLILPIEGIQDVPYLTNRNVMDLVEPPEHMIVIGGSYIGLEFGQMYRRFGSEVTVVEFMDNIIPREDEEVSTTLQEALEAEGIRFLLSAKASRVSQDENGQLHVTVEPRDGGQSQVLTGSHILLAAGRKPNTEELNLEAAGIATNRGWIEVNEYLETNVPGVYALGDVKGGPAFTHISYNDFQIAFHNLLHEERRSITGRIVPYALFTEPELGRVGLTERDAREQGYNIKVGSIPMGWVARAIESNQTTGLMKVVINADTDRILGAAILGPSGGELVQTLMALMMADAPWTVFYKAVYIHPTLTEGFFSLMDNVQ